MSEPDEIRRRDEAQRTHGGGVVPGSGRPFRADMRFLEGEAALNPLGMADVYVDDGSEWVCPCGGLKLGPLEPCAVPVTVSSRCRCGTVVAIRAPEIGAAR